MSKKNQSTRLTNQHKVSKGVIGIFGEDAKKHDIAVGEISKIVKSKNVQVKRPDGSAVILNYNSGVLNRLDRLSAANYGMPFNKNLCKNKFVKHSDKIIMLQAASMYTKGDGSKWEAIEMFNIMMEISETSLKMLGSDIFNQITVGRK